MHPLSHAQRAMWHVHQLVPEGSMYHISLATTVLSGLDVPALRRALQALTDRHPALRTTITIRDGEAVQIVHPSLPADLKVVSDSTLSEGDFVREADRPFDLTSQPPLRVRVLTGTGGHRLLFTFHHIAWDFESIVIGFEDLARLYHVEVTGELSTAEDPGAPYTEYVNWESSIIDSDIGASSLAYWMRQLEAMPAATELPGDHPRPAVRSYVGAMRHSKIASEQAVAIELLAKEAGVTRYVLLLAVFNLVLSRLTGRRDIVIGTASSQRMRTDFRRTVGNFTNSMPLWTEVDGGQTFRELLAGLSSRVFESLRHAMIPFPAVVEHARPAYDPSRLPVFDVLFVYDRPRNRRRDGITAFVSGRGEADLGGLVLRSYPLPCTSTMYDLTAYVFDATDELSIRWEYNSDLVDRERVIQLERHFQAMLADVLSHPDERLSQVDGMPGDERRAVLEDVNDTATDWADPVLVHELVERQVDLTPDEIAVSFCGNRLTYRELDRRANQVAHRLCAAGVGPESVVPVCLGRSLELVVALLGVLKAGGAYLPLDPEHPLERLTGIVSESGARFVVTAPEMDLPGHEVLTIDGTWASITDEPTDRPVSSTSGDNLAYVIYTSGSTGQPKGVMNTHAGVVNRLRWTQDRYGLDAADRVLQKTPYGFDVSVWEFFWPLSAGARLVLAEPGGHRDVAYLVDVINHEGITTIHFVPSMLQSFLASPALVPLPSLRRVLCSGEALTRAHIEKFREAIPCELHNLYGPTEAAIDVTEWQCPDSSVTTVAIGKPIANARVYVLDEEMRPAPVGVAGELYLAGVQLARGYLARAGLTAERFVPDPFRCGRLYRTGDIGRWNRDGELEYLGRADQQVKIRGYRVEPAEVESLVAQHPLVSDAVVDVHEDETGQRLVAYVVVTDPAKFTITELRSALRVRSPEYLIPAGIVVVDELPRGVHGKLDRARLPAPTDNAWVHRAGYVAPRTPIEEELALQWKQLLGVEQVGMHDNFFDIGGHSLAATRMVTGAGDHLGVRIPVNEIFATPTLEAFALAVFNRMLDEADDEDLVGYLAEDAAPDVLTLPQADSDGLAALAARLARVPGDFETVVENSEFARLCDQLPTNLQTALDEFAAAVPKSGYLVVQGIPVSDVPATPTQYGGDVLGRHPTSDLLAVIASRLGGAIGYEDEKFGALIHDVHPVRRDAGKQTNSGSVLLDLHTENVHHPLRPTHVGLLCVRQDPDASAATLVASVHEAVELLSVEDVELLSQSTFSHRFPLSFALHHHAEELAVPTGPVLEPDQTRGWRLRFDSCNTVAADPDTDRALRALHEALGAVRREVRLPVGGMLIVDNSLVAHGRTSFTPRYDGTDRWLRRFYAYDGTIPPGALVRAGRRVVRRDAYGVRP